MQTKRRNPYREAESILDLRANPNMPLVIRVDGRSFSSLSRRFMEKPFDEGFTLAMDDVAMALAETMEGARCVYVQSDEASVVMVCPRERDPWFDWRIQKVTTCAAAVASVAFANTMTRLGRDEGRYAEAASTLPTFDARALQVESSDVCGYLAWRQNDAKRNAISQAAYATLGPKATKGLTTWQMREKLAEAGIDFEDYPERVRTGGLVVRRTYEKVGLNPLTGESRVVSRQRWERTGEMPNFSTQAEQAKKLMGLD